MHTILTQASKALSHNDAAALEDLCAQLVSSAPPSSPDEQHALHAAVLVFKRQVLAARTNLVLRERLLTARVKEVAPWAV